MAHTSAPDGGPASPVTPAPGPALLLFLTLLAPTAAVQAQQGPLQPTTATVWQPLTLDFEGPFSSEDGVPNPFLDYRLDVTFRHDGSGLEERVPGYFAADGQAAETGATAGTIWRVRFSPPAAGLWTWTVSFVVDAEVAVSDDLADGQPVAFHGASGSFLAAPADIFAPGFLGSGPVVANGTHYWRSTASGRPFIKLGANSPENLLAYVDFDQTPGSHAYAAHLGDWQPGDPAWHGGQDGRGLIGGLNYLADSGLNAVYLLTFNVGGDGNDVWPWTAPGERLRYDCSKLDQWGLVLDHMDRRGLLAHLVLQETEIDDEPGLALDDGELGTERRLYHRELVARFGHKLGLAWNLGEENQNTTDQLLAFADHLRELDGGRHPLTLHTYPDVGQFVYPPLVAAKALDGASLQVATPEAVHETVLSIRELGLEADHPWAVHLDEIGPPDDGVVPDSSDPLHTTVRRQALWGALMAGGAGVEWYFGYAHPHDDLDCEDWRSRAEMWRQTAVAGDLFRDHLPLDDLEPDDDRLHGAEGWVLSDPGQYHAVYLVQGGLASLKLGGDQSTYMLRWYDPRLGGPFQKGSVTQLKGPGLVSLGQPPSAPFQDWAAVAVLLNSGPTIEDIDVLAEAFGDAEGLQLDVWVADPDGAEDVIGVDVHVVTPGGDYLGHLSPDPVEGPHWSLFLSDLPPLASGAWTLYVLATDSAGHSALRELTYLAP